MSVAAMTWAYEQDLPPLAKFTLITVCDEVSERNEWPLDVERIVERTGMERHEVIETLVILQNTDKMTRALVEDHTGKRVEGFAVHAPHWREVVR